MRIYCLISFWLACFGIGARAYFITQNDYPRIVTYASAIEDLMWLLLSAFCAVWLFSLLWGWH